LAWIETFLSILVWNRLLYTKRAMRVRSSALTAVLFATAFAQTPTTFAPLTQWKAAVIRGDSAKLMSLFSTSPPVRVTVVTKGRAEVSAEADAAFWMGLKARSIELNISESSSPQPGVRQINFEATVRTAPPGRTLYILAAQLWQQQGNDWKLIATERTDARRLEQPQTLDAKLYPAGDARQEIRDALTRASANHKRVLVVFGADWCYDCHVLDKAFRRVDIAPVVKANFELVHVDVGEGDKNQDLMTQYQVPMSRGIPGMAVLDPDGKLVYSQKSGEFERARALGPEDLLAFLNQWKLQAR
jgi:thioredoxin 1